MYFLVYIYEQLLQSLISIIDQHSFYHSPISDLLKWINLVDVETLAMKCENHLSLKSCILLSVWLKSFVTVVLNLHSFPDWWNLL